MPVKDLGTLLTEAIERGKKLDDDFYKGRSTVDTSEDWMAKYKVGGTSPLLKKQKYRSAAFDVNATTSDHEFKIKSTALVNAEQRVECLSKQIDETRSLLKKLEEQKVEAESTLNAVRGTRNRDEPTIDSDEVGSW